MGRQGPNLLLRARYSEVPLYGTFIYDSEDDRDHAAGQVEGLKETVWDQDLEVTLVFRQPSTPVPSRRFLRAIGVVLGERIGAVYGGAVTRRLDSPPNPDEAIEARAKVLDVVRARCSPLEELAYRLEVPTGYGYSWTADWSETVVIQGRAGARTFDAASVPRLEDGFHRFAVAQALDLRPGEQLGLITVHYGRATDDPVVAELDRLAQNAASFNKSQTARQIDLDEGLLQAELTQATERLFDDASALARGLGLDSTSIPSGTTTYIVVELEGGPSERFPRGMLGLAKTLEARNDTGRQLVRVRVLGPEERMKPPEIGDLTVGFRELFEEDIVDPVSSSNSEVRYMIADMLGHEAGEVWVHSPVYSGE